jgi:hypothetical protein
LTDASLRRDRKNVSRLRERKLKEDDETLNEIDRPSIEKAVGCWVQEDESQDVYGCVYDVDVKLGKLFVVYEAGNNEIEVSDVRYDTRGLIWFEGDKLSATELITIAKSEKY